MTLALDEQRTSRQRPRIVIVGAGFGGLFCARALHGADADVVLIDRQNHHLFQPLLYQVATCGLSPADIAWPIRKVLRRQANLTVLMDEVSGIDRARRTVALSDRALTFDYLVMAPGSQPSYFGQDDWAAHAPGLKTLDDALLLRRDLLTAFEQAEATTDPQERQRLMTFVIVGGGPTGVELAGNLAELARFALARDFRNIDPADARIILCDMADRVLTAYPPSLSAYALKTLQKIGVDVQTDRRIASVDVGGVTFADGEHIAAATVLWTAGNAASGLTAHLVSETDRAGRIKVTSNLHLPQDDRIFVIGDAALTHGADGKALPGVAPVAKQQGAFVGRLLRDRLAGKRQSITFRYRNYGNMAIIGRNAAIADFGRLQMRGRLGWWLWGLVHIWFLIGLRSPFFVILNWLFSYWTYEQGARLITGRGSSGEDHPNPAPQSETETKTD